jgi:putative transposase
LRSVPPLDWQGLPGNKEAIRPAGREFLQQQAKFDRVIQCCNFERRHQPLNLQYPAELYSPSPRPYQGLGELEYPLHDRTVLAGQDVGIREVSDKVWLVRFMQYDLECSCTHCPGPRAMTSR